MSASYRVTTLDNLGKYQDIIFEHSIAAAATGGTIGAVIPGVDTVGVSAIWLTMVARIADKANHPTDKAIIQKFIINILQGAACYLVGTAVLRLLMISTGVGLLGAAVMNGILNFLYTARLGIFIAEQFDKPGFSMEHTLSMIDSAQKIIFAIPTAEELKFAFKVTQHN